MLVEHLKKHDRVLAPTDTGDSIEMEVHSVIKDDSLLDRVIVVWWGITHNVRSFVGTSTFVKGEVIDAVTA